jgi:tetratricopeptide (TPR) repeat protein
MGAKKHRQKPARPPEPQKPSPTQTLAPTQTRTWLVGSRWNLVWALLLVALTLIVYLQVSRFGLIELDDDEYVGDNIWVNQGLTHDSVAWAFSGFHFANWIPLTWLSLMLDASLFGRSPTGNHITNLVLHAANVLWVFALFVKATGNTPRSAFVAALFAVHPLHVESVAWISERKDVLSMFFGLAALWLYVAYAQGRRWTPLVLAWLSLALSLMAKQTFVTLPFVFLLLDFWPLGRLTGEITNTPPPARDVPGRALDWRRLWRLILDKVPFFALTVVFCVVAVKAQASGQAIVESIPLGTRLVNAVLAYGIYLWRAVVPVGLAPFYPLPAEGPSVADAAVSLVVLAAITGFATAGWRKRPYVLTGWLWYLGTFVPVIGIVQIGRQQLADRYAYLPLLGIYLAVAWLVPSLVREATLGKRLLPAAAAVVVAIYAAIGFHQVGYWSDGVKLFRHALAVTADNSTARAGLGSALFYRDRFPEALPHLEQAAKLDPQNAHAHLSLGRGLDAVGHSREAFAEFQAAIALDPKNVHAENEVGAALLAQGQLAEAQRHFERAIEIDPAYASGYANLGIVYARLGQSAKAIDLCEKALRLDPSLLPCHQTIATALADLGRYDEAIARLQNVLRAEPGNQDAKDELARITALKEGRLRAANR